MPTLLNALMGGAASSQKGFHKQVIMGRGRAKAIASDHAGCRNANRQMEAFIPANAGTFANISLTRPSIPIGANLGEKGPQMGHTAIA